MAPIVRAASLLSRVDTLEQHACRAINRLADRALVRSLFRLVSRLGDGVFWYVLITLLAAVGPEGRQAALSMAVAGLLGLFLYRGLKTRLCRERPYIGCPGVRQAARALDRYSFPSGHTLHAVCFTTVALAWFPELAGVLVPFSMLVATSRVVLGLHYPSDVVAGGVMGVGLAHGVMAALSGL